MPFVPYLLLAKIAVVIALLGGFAFGAHKYNDHQQQVGYDRAVAEYKEKEDEAKKAAAKIESDLRTQLKAALESAGRRNARIDAANASAVAANDSLRSTIDALRNSVPGATASALADTIHVTSALLGACGERYQGLAGKADRHASDVQTLRDAWPSYEVKK